MRPNRYLLELEMSGDEAELIIQAYDHAKEKQADDDANSFAERESDAAEMRSSLCAGGSHEAGARQTPNT